MQVSKQDLPTRQLQCVWKAMDADGTGFITSSEFSMLMKAASLKDFPGFRAQRELLTDRDLVRKLHGEARAIKLNPGRLSTASLPGVKKPKRPSLGAGPGGTGAGAAGDGRGGSQGHLRGKEVEWAMTNARVMQARRATPAPLPIPAPRPRLNVRLPEH